MHAPKCCRAERSVKGDTMLTDLQLCASAQVSRARKICAESAPMGRSYSNSGMSASTLAT